MLNAHCQESRLISFACVCVHALGAYQGSANLWSVFWTPLAKTGHQHHEGQKTLKGEDEKVHPEEEVAGNMTEHITKAWVES